MTLAKDKEDRQHEWMAKETWASKHQSAKDLFGGTSPLRRHNSSEDKDLKRGMPEDFLNMVWNDQKHLPNKKAKRLFTS